MTQIVLDASATLAWIFTDETSAGSCRLLDEVVREGAVVPLVWKLEVGNTLLFAERRGRISSDHRRRALASLLDLPIVMDGETDARAWNENFRLAQQYALTLYDACYLELASRLGLSLATRDRDLSAAAVASGVPLFDS